MKANHPGEQSPELWPEALAAFHSGQTEKAQMLCKALTGHDPGHGGAHNLLGAIALKRKDYPIALAAFGKAVSSEPEKASYHNNLGIALRAMQRFDEARKCYQQAVALQPDYPDAFFNLGNVLRDLNDETRAVEAYRRATELKPDYQAAWNNLGNALRALGRQQDAIAAYRNALALRDDAQTQSNLAIALKEAGDAVASSEVLHRLVAARPDDPALQVNLADALVETGDRDAAVEHFLHALMLKPDYAHAANKLGKVYLAQGLTLCALEYYRLALHWAPDQADYWTDAGHAFKALGNTAMAAGSYRQALTLQPDDSGCLFNLANTLWERLRRNLSATAVDSREIETLYLRLIAIAPQSADAHSRLAALYLAQNNEDAALRCYQRAVELAPDSYVALFNLANLYHSAGDIVSARNYYEKGLRVKNHDGVRIRMGTMVEPTPVSEQAIADFRADLDRSLDELLAAGLTIRDPMADIAVAPMFYLAYHGLNNAGLMAKYARLVEQACPALNYVAPHCGKGSREGREKIRIGFASKFFKSHTVGRFFRGILRHFDRQRFEIHAFMVASPQDELTHWIAAHVDGFHILAGTLAEARMQVAAAELDILVYTDIGMESFSYYLAFSRLAPVQCVLYGHPDTTGIGTIDYFLSSAACELPEADAHYTESLVRLDKDATYTYYYRHPSVAKKNRRDYGLGETAHLYTCAQSLFKLHPLMDEIFDEILDRDPQGRLLLFNDMSAVRLDAMKRRLAARMRHFARVGFLPRMELPDFLQILSLSDAVLDSVHFCGGSTSFDSFSVDAPVVTLPGEFMRGRQTYGLYRRMGMMDLVAKDRADYVDKALLLGGDTAYREAMREKIRALSPAIYQDAGMVKALEAFFASVLD